MDSTWRDVALPTRIQSPHYRLGRAFTSDESIHISRDESSVWKKTTQRLLDNAVGSLTPYDWNAAQQTISWWTRQRTREGVDRSWSILDRLVEEEKRHPTKSDPLRMTEMTEWLNRIVDAWRILIERETLDQTHGDSLMEANEILARLDCYKPYLLPDAQTYNMVVDAVTIRETEGPGVARFAEQVLERMHQESGANPLVRPNVVSYNSAMNAWAKSGLPEGPKKAEGLFRRMEELGLKPDTTSFGIVISAWANSRDPSVGKRAEAILNQMQKLYEAGNPDVKPNTVTFNSAITAWANSRDPSAGKRAEAILNQMQKLYEAGNPDVKPNTISFSSVITAWANSRDPTAANRAKQFSIKCRSCTKLVTLM
jgi:pentatricopeptide repeat protein